MLKVTDTEALNKLANSPAAGETTVDGVVSYVGASKKVKVYYVDFKGVDGTNGFVAIFYPPTLKLMVDAFPGGGDVPALKGKHIRVTGEVTTYQGRPEIQIRSPKQVKVVD